MTQEKSCGGACETPWSTVGAKWQGGLKFQGSDSRGNKIILNHSGEEGTEKGFSPMELLLVGLAGCTGMDVAQLMRDKGLEDLKVEVSGMRREESPKIYTRINVKYIIKGEIDYKTVEKAVKLSQDRLCSTKAMLGESAEINWEIVSG